MEQAIHSPQRPPHGAAIEDVARHGLIFEVEVLEVRLVAHRQAQLVAALGEQSGDLRADEARATREEGLGHRGQSSDANPALGQFSRYAESLRESLLTREPPHARASAF
jgi:hypothetical protein